MKNSNFRSPSTSKRVPFGSPFCQKLGPLRVPFLQFLGPLEIWEQCIPNPIVLFLSAMCCQCKRNVKCLMLVIELLSSLYHFGFRAVKLEKWPISNFGTECDDYIRIFKYSNILVTNIYSDIRSYQFFFYEYIRTFVRVKFVCTNIFGHSLVSVLECKT